MHVVRSMQERNHQRKVPQHKDYKVLHHLSWVQQHHHIQDRPQERRVHPEEGAVRNYEKAKPTETEDDILARLQKEEEEDQKYHLLQAKRKKNPFWNEQTLGMENLEQRLKEQHHHQKLDQQLEAIQARAVNKDLLESKARENLQQSTKPVAKRKLVIPTTIKLPKNLDLPALILKLKIVQRKYWHVRGCTAWWYSTLISCNCSTNCLVSDLSISLRHKHTPRIYSTEQS